MPIHFNFDWICSDIEYELSLLRDFFITYHENLPDSKEKGEKEISKYLQNYDDEDEYIANASGLYNEHFMKYEEYFPNQINYLLIIMLYTFLERNLKKICDDYVKRLKLPLSIEGFEGDLGTKFMNFIKCFKPNAYTERDIQTIKEIGMIRNYLVHENGYININQKKIVNFINAKGAKGGEILIESNQIIIRKAFCNEYIERTARIFKNVFDGLNYRTTYTVSII